MHGKCDTGSVRLEESHDKGATRVFEQFEIAERSMSCVGEKRTGMPAACHALSVSDLLDALG
jgi:hypothetical protein